MRRLTMWAVFASLACVVLARAEANDVDRQILGAWKLQFTTPDGVQRTPVVIIGRQYQQYVAWYVADQQPEPFRDVQLKGETLVGTISPQERPGMTVTLESKLNGENQCVGTARYHSTRGDGAGQWSFVGHRMAVSSFDEVMTWKLRFVAPDNEQHESTVTVVTKDGQRYAWYSGRDHELPARRIAIDGNRVTMSMTAQTPEGSQVDVTFRGTVTGNAVSGSAEYRVGSDAGSFPFQGTRAS